MTVLAVLQHPLGLALGLPDPLPGDAQLFAEFREGGRVMLVEAVAADEFVPCPLRQPLDCGTQALDLRRADP
jgi:hypothetical protein